MFRAALHSYIRSNVNGLMQDLNVVRRPARCSKALLFYLVINRLFSKFRLVHSTIYTLMQRIFTMYIACNG